MDEQIKQIDELLKVLSRQASYGDSRAANLVPVYKELRQAYVTQAILQKNVEDAAHALTDVRRFVEAKWMSVADLPSEEAVLFDGPEPKHEANAIIAALNRVAEYYEKE